MGFLPARGSAQAQWSTDNMHTGGNVWGKYSGPGKGEKIICLMLHLAI